MAATVNNIRAKNLKKSNGTIELFTRSKLEFSAIGCDTKPHFSPQYFGNFSKLQTR